jgi:hypothetical protein
MSNWEEYVAGTDPTNSSSYLKVDSVAANGGATITFNALARKTYTVQFTTALDGGSWIKLADAAARPTDHIETVFDANYSTNRFYRLVTPRQP